MVAVDVQLQDYLLSHYETVVNHNFDLEKIRYERRIDSIFKTANISSILFGPAFGKLVETSLSIFQTFAIYFDAFNENDFTDYYLRDNLFDSSGYIQSKGEKRYALSDDDSDRRDAMVANSNHFFLIQLIHLWMRLPIIDSIHFP